MNNFTDLPQSLEARFALAKQRQATYEPNINVARQLQTITLGSLIGVTSIGKSYLIPQVIQYGGLQFSEVGNISSRVKRDTDPEHFRGSQPITELLGRIERGEMVNYTVHPSGDIYGTDLESYTTNFALLPTLTSSLPQLQAMDCFKRVVPIGLVTDGPTWQKRISEKLLDPKIVTRLHEALDCTSWLLANASYIPILENETGREEATARAIIDIMQDPLHPHPLDNLQRINFLLPQLGVVASNHLQKLETT